MSELNNIEKGDVQMSNIFNEIFRKELKSINGGSVILGGFPSPIEQFDAIAHCYEPSSAKHTILNYNYIKAMKERSC